MSYISFKRLEKVLNDKGLKWHYLIEKGISPGIVQKLHHGGNIDTRTLVKVCDLLNVQPSEFMDYIKE